MKKSYKTKENPMSKWIKKRRKKKRHQNIHHIFPTSRVPELKNVKWNKVFVDAKMHNIYHQLFENRTPREIVQFLNENFWKGQEVQIWIPQKKG